MKSINSEELNIWAVVVTYNRLELLKRNIQSIRSQILKPNKILVVNNGSTDGTKEWLENQDDIISITQDNTGGAGGFYTGFKEAYEGEAEWIWAMDEDGEANEFTLLELVKCFQPDVYIINSLVLDITNINNLSSAIAQNFSLNGSQDLKVHYSLEEINKIKENSVGTIVGFPFFFNSSLINKDVITSVGYPNKHFFIRGDELDFYFRMLRSGYTAYISLNSIYLHPSTMNKRISILGKSFYYEQMNSFKFFYHTRNSIFLRNKYLKKDIGLVGWLFNKGADILIKEILVFLCREKRFSELLVSIRTFFKAKSGLTKIKDELNQDKFF